jgi:hypothetical protein
MRFKVSFFKLTSLAETPVHEETIEAPSRKTARKIAAELMRKLRCDAVPSSP